MKNTKKYHSRSHHYQKKLSSIEDISEKHSDIQFLFVSDFHPSKIVGGAPAIAEEYFQTLKIRNIQSYFYSASELKLPFRFKSKILKYRRNSSTIRLLTNLITSTIYCAKFIYAARAIRPRYIWIHSIGNKIPIFSLYLLSLLQFKFFVTLHDFNAISRQKIQAEVKGNQLVPIIPSRFKDKIYQRINIGALRRSLFCATLSRHQSDIFKSMGLLNLKSIPNGVELCEHKYLKKNQLDFSKLKILFAGRGYGKGIPELMRALETQDNTNVEIYVAGGPELLNYIDVKHLNKKVFYKGRLPREVLTSFIHEIDIVIVNSQYFDPYPTVGLEGIRHNALVITSESSGLVDLYNSQDLKQLVLKLGEEIDFEKLASLYVTKRQFLREVNVLIPTPHQVVDNYLSELDAQDGF